MFSSWLCWTRRRDEPSTTWTLLLSLQHQLVPEEAIGLGVQPPAVLGDLVRVTRRAGTDQVAYGDRGGVDVGIIQLRHEAGSEVRDACLAYASDGVAQRGQGRYPEPANSKVPAPRSRMTGRMACAAASASLMSIRRSASPRRRCGQRQGRFMAGRG
jgi:hypothetical protein